MYPLLVNTMVALYGCIGKYIVIKPSNNPFMKALTLIEALILGLCPPLICMKKSQEETYTSNLYNKLSVENHALLRTFQSELNY